nr:hypothetical protein [Tanacetum cinerariifolium]
MWLSVQAGKSCRVATGEELNTVSTLTVPLNFTPLMTVYHITDDDNHEKTVDVVADVAFGYIPSKKKKDKSKKILRDVFGANESGTSNPLGLGDQVVKGILTIFGVNTTISLGAHNLCVKIYEIVLEVHLAELKLDKDVAMKVANEVP